MSREDFFANPDSAENQNEISVQPDVDAQTSEQDRIPRSLSDTHERRFRANLVRYYDEETAKIIMEARAQAKKDIAEGRIQNMTEGVSPEFYTDKEMAQDASLKKAHDNWEKQQKRDKARKRRQMPDRYGFKRWQKIAASVLITLVVLGSVTMSTDALRVPIVKFFSSSKTGYNMVMAETGSGDSNYHEYIENVYVLSETLDGYEEISRTDGKRMIWIEYQNSNENIYDFYQTADASVSNWMDNADASYEKYNASIGDVYFQSKDGLNTLVWAYDGYVFKLSGNISKGDMILLADSLTLEQ